MPAGIPAAHSLRETATPGESTKPAEGERLAPWRSCPRGGNVDSVGTENLDGVEVKGSQKRDGVGELTELVIRRDHAMLGEKVLGWSLQ